MAHSTSSHKENRLAHEKSPYLLQHKNNPVDWYPWGEEAFAKARKEDKPIFLSVGYSTCHWCHVMARESFESDQIAQIMNENFVNIKIDREERPDIDKIYMTFVQATSGHGGWPMSVFLTPDLTPFLGGTYFPPVSKYGQPGFPDILESIAEMWENQRDELVGRGVQITEAIKKSLEQAPGRKHNAISAKTIQNCFLQIFRSYDSKLGGFSSAPKFPRPSIFNFLFSFYNSSPEGDGKKALQMSLFTLTEMAKGGMYDHIGGGFHRYSVTADWHVPHFEKMLYDNAQLVNSYLDAYQISKDPFFADKAKDVLEYVLSKLTSPLGGFYSAEDADSPLPQDPSQHAEGAFYVWTAEEISAALDSETASVFSFHFDVKPKGNVPRNADPHGELTAKNVLIQRQSLAETAQQFSKTEEEIRSLLEKARKTLYSLREKRPRPHLDDKIITAWNGLMISAFARAYQVLREEKYLHAAIKASEFIQKNLFIPETQRLIRNFRDSPSKVEGFTDDYSFLIAGLLDLYEASFDSQWLKWALVLQEQQDKLFYDRNHGGYFAAKEGGADLLLRLKEDYDGAEPSNNSVSAFNLLRLWCFTGNEKYRTDAQGVFDGCSAPLSQHPIVLPHMCAALNFFLSTPKQIVLVGNKQDPSTKEMISQIHQFFIPNKILLFVDEEVSKVLPNLEYTKDMKASAGKTTVYVCENYACQLPVSEPQQLAKLLGSKL